MGLVINANLKEAAEDYRTLSLASVENGTMENANITALQSIATSNLVIIDLLERILSTLCEKDT